MQEQNNINEIQKIETEINIIKKKLETNLSLDRRKLEKLEIKKRDIKKTITISLLVILLEIIDGVVFGEGVFINLYKLIMLSVQNVSTIISSLSISIYIPLIIGFIIYHFSLNDKIEKLTEKISTNLKNIDLLEELLVLSQEKLNQLKKDNTEQKQEILDISEKNFLTNIYKILEYYKTNKEVLKTKDVEVLREEIKSEKELRLVRNLPKNELEN